MSHQINFGIDSFLLQNERYRNLRIGIVTNDAATTSDGSPSRVALLKNQFNLVRIFSPEHGITVKGDDGVLQGNSRDTVTGLPVISLYNEKLGPSEEGLQDLDLILFDIPDVGCRFYTYLWTMTYVMEACAKYGKPFMVLDRPNPIGALLENAEGPMLDEQHCSSFIGRWNIPLKHCCTSGELALYFASTRLPAISIEVVKAVNYKRHHRADQDFTFIPTSPAIRNVHTAMLYPGTGLWEGILVNEGRGSDRPFEQIGAPWMKSEQLCDALTAILKNVKAEPVHYKPISGVYANEVCHGISLNITTPSAFMAVESGILILQTILRLYPQEAGERLYITNANPTGERHMDKLLGCVNAYERLKQQGNIDLNVSEQWYDLIHPYLLYS
jgi:uncharacterized protein YbbC (DUF1343 family)